MGYLLDEMHWNRDLAQLLFEFLQTEKFFPILISPRRGQKAGSTGNRWKIDVNIELESDL
jgi:hypothetical protein